MGKTALALDVAAGMAPALTDGAVVVDLAGTTDAFEVAEVVSTTLGLSEAAGDDPLRRTAAALDGRELLVLLDNCEHVVDEAARLAVALLHSGAAVRVLATSQERLRVAGEAVVMIEPLELPADLAGRAAIEASDACTLLAQRLTALGRPPASNDDWRAVAAVARGAGGLPLALEVAAAWARVERLELVAERLGSDEVLRAEPPVGVGRRSLGVALDAAVERLTAEGRVAYTSASLFPAWFGPEALAATAGIDEVSTRAALRAMVGVSLVMVDPSDRDRVRLLPPVRRHAAQLLAAEGREELALRALTDWCLLTASELDAGARGPGNAQAVQCFMADLATLRMALRRSLDDGRIDDAADLYQRLALCWASSPAAPEATHWGKEVLGHADMLPPSARLRVEVLTMQTADTFEKTASHLEQAERVMVVADAAGDTLTGAHARMVAAVGLGWRGEDLERTAELLAEARASTVAEGDAFWAAEALMLQGLLALRQLDLGTATTRLEAALAEHQAVGTPVGIGRALFFLGFVRRFAGDLERARSAFLEAQRLLAQGRVITWLRATIGLAQTELQAGDIDAAETSFRTAHERANDVGDQRASRAALVGLAGAARQRHDDGRAEALLLAAARHALSTGDLADAANAATNLADLLSAQVKPASAALLLGAAAQVPPEPGFRLDGGGSSSAGTLARLAEHVGADELARLQHEGQLLGLEAVLARF